MAGVLAKKRLVHSEKKKMNHMNHYFSGPFCSLTSWITSFCGLWDAPNKNGGGYDFFRGENGLRSETLISSTFHLNLRIIQEGTLPETNLAHLR